VVEISADDLAGILPPPLTKPVGSLIRDELFDLHMARLAALSLHPNVYLKLLPPVVENKVETWYDHKKELDKVIKAYRKSDLRTLPSPPVVHPPHSTPLSRTDSQSHQRLTPLDSTESSLVPPPPFPVLISDDEPVLQSTSSTPTPRQNGTMPFEDASRSSARTPNHSKWSCSPTPSKSINLVSDQYIELPLALLRIPSLSRYCSLSFDLSLGLRP
jgi:hypothetical protein